MLVAKQLTKTYGNKTALSSLSFSFDKGVIGLLGANGAGKTTLIKIISTILKPDSGSLHFNDVDVLKKPKTLRKTLGLVPQDFGVYPNLNAVEFLSYIGTLKGISGKVLTKRVYTLLESLNLIDADKIPLRSYSGGMKQRIGIAQALLNDPKILIFDEPTVGLDPSERINFREILKKLGQDRLIFLSSHIVSDIATIADQVMILKKGQLTSINSVNNIIENLTGKVQEMEVAHTDMTTFKHKHSIIHSSDSRNGLKIRFVANDHLIGSRIMTPTLEDAYVYSTLN